MVEFNNEEMQGERRETFVVLEDRLSEDSALKAIQEKLRPLLKRGFAGIAEKRMAECGLSNPYVYGILGSGKSDLRRLFSLE